MADQGASAKWLENGVDAQQPLKDTTEISTENNSGEIEFIDDDYRKIFVGGLTEDITENDLDLHFSQFGEIQYINIKVNYATGRSRGFAFIVFMTVKGVDNALACTNHVINDKIVDPKKAVPRQVKLFVGGLSSYLTDDDIKDYFKRYAPLVAYDMPYSEFKNKRRSFCFITFDNIQAINEILKASKHVINGKQVEVKKAKLSPDFEVKKSLRSMSRMQENFRDQRGRRGFPRQYEYTPVAPCNYSGRYYNNNLFIGYNPQYSHTYGYPSYGASGRADYQFGGYKPFAPYGGYKPFVQHGGYKPFVQHGGYKPFAPRGGYKPSAPYSNFENQTTE